MIDRRTLLGYGTAGLVTGLAGGCAFPAIHTSRDRLRFDPAAFTERNRQITTGSGQHSVVYRFYRAIPYVANPVDARYQSLNISVPISIDGQPINAGDAPILLANGVGGYMPSSVIDAMDVGGPADPGGPTGMGVPPPRAAPMGHRVNKPEYALAAGMVVVEPGVRGRTLVDDKGRYYGTAPAAIVDLKAAVRYLRHNAGIIPGDVGRIISTGTSAGGALSALLGASGDSHLYDPYLQTIGAADASDAIHAVGAWCPITDLEHADMAYEWNWGELTPASDKGLDRGLSDQLKAMFADYQRALGLSAGDGMPLTAETYDRHLIHEYLIPAATRYLAALPEDKRQAYLAQHPLIGWSNGTARFEWADYLRHVGSRKKSAPAFDALDLSTGENNLFGNNTVKAQHFTPFGAAESGAGALSPDIAEKTRLMNPMHFLASANAGRARRWWLRVGTKDTDTALTVVGNLAARTRQLGDAVDTAMYWDAGHGADEDPDAFVRWAIG
ncbi:Tat pathway signal sequence domain protein (plasmid) [Sphingomonas changnyeongensis]|uniref:Tat pathway signal sequence domain protein n=1 Tax=Sphingomonas changnyeongensis TaxID=2698679 RepID=A0A7Z2NY76_9SPHN|nr:subtype B tannase [Sphingomonas changnyeongensis]QHL92015.1 Tat pathway signal sequence domain protein [Sphingomonas changnyeongensis]